MCIRDSPITNSSLSHTDPSQQRLPDEVAEEVGEGDGLALTPLLQDTFNVAVHALGPQQPEGARVHTALQFLLQLSRGTLREVRVRVQVGQVPDNHTVKVRVQVGQVLVNQWYR